MGCQALDAVLQILFEIAEVEKVRLDEAAVKGPLDRNLSTRPSRAWQWRFASRTTRSRGLAAAVR
jgi:hypothetical protein